jgi:hypothetical protein
MHVMFRDPLRFPEMPLTTAADLFTLSVNLPSALKFLSSLACIRNFRILTGWKS